MIVAEGLLEPRRESLGWQDRRARSSRFTGGDLVGDRR